MVKDQLLKDLSQAVRSAGLDAEGIELSIPENESFGDYSTNIALQQSNHKDKNGYHLPREIANKIAEKLSHPVYLERVDIAGQGFINFFIKDQFLVKNLNKDLKAGNDKRKILVEFAHPNSHKAFHIGHLRNISLGESISRLLEFQGVEVFRVTYGGDIGPHVAKALWGVMQLKQEYDHAKHQSSREKAEFLGKAYALGSQKYEADSAVKAEIDQINKRLYQRDPELAPLWEETKVISVAYFESLYSRLGTEFDAQIWESEIEETGRKIVEENLGKVFVEDQGAIIFPGEKYELHNRVFITSAGYPTYEGKELGLTQREEELFPFDLSLHIVANEQIGFFQVVIKALELIEAKRKGKKHHLPYGMVNLSTGKMSSRKGDIVTAERLIDQVNEEVTKFMSGVLNVRSNDKVVEKITIGAIKFWFLKYALNSDIAFDVKQSVSLQGDSGSYVLYAFARANSVLTKSELKNPKSELKFGELEDQERKLLRQLEYFELIAQRAANNYQPSELAAYLLKLAKAFNLFYENFPVIGSQKEAFRIVLVRKVAEVLKLGLELLGIETLEKM